MVFSIDTILENYAEVAAKVESALLRVNRPLKSVEIIVVTKRQSLEKISAIIQHGIHQFGENYPEELARKSRFFTSESINLKWHLIGPLQSRKRALAVSESVMIHSIDRLKIAKEVNQCAKKLGKVMPVLLQFNVSGEESKSGWQAWSEGQWEDLLPEIQEICQLDFIQVKGLMTLPPFSESAEESRPVYQKLRQLQKYLTNNIPHASFHDLSIGTSFDYEVAVEEGATHIRVGEAILGQREQR